VILRETQSSGNDLHFKYGSNASYQNNSTRFEITNDGPVRSHCITPFTDNGGTSGTGSLRWNEVFSTNGVTTTSDLRAKKDIEDLDNGLGLLTALRPVRYRWKSAPNGDLSIGLIVQEVEPIIPEVVHAPESDSAYYGLNYAELVPVVIKAIQEQQAMIDHQQVTIDHQQDAIMCTVHAYISYASICIVHTYI